MTAGVRLLLSHVAMAAPSAFHVTADTRSWRRLQQIQQTAVVAMTTSAPQHLPGMAQLAPSHSFHTAHHLPVALPGKSAWLAFLVAVHVCALLYWAYAFLMAQRRASHAVKGRDPPPRLKCVYEWTSNIALPKQIKPLNLGLTRS